MLNIPWEFEQWRRHIERICALLGLVDVTLLRTERGGRVHCGQPTVAHINPDPMHYPQEIVSWHPVREIAHELRHLYQIQNGFLKDVNFGAVLWRGKLSYLVYGNPQAYVKQPWELDANSFAADYMETYGVDLETDLTRKAIRVQMNVDTPPQKRAA